MTTFCKTNETQTQVETNAVIAVFDELPVAHLRDLADRRGWAYLAEPRVGNVLRAVRATQADAVIVHVSPALINEATDLLAGLRNYWVKPAVVATARSEDETIELAVRQAGVSSFIACDDDTLLLECHVANSRTQDTKAYRLSA